MDRQRIPDGARSSARSPMLPEQHLIPGQRQVAAMLKAVFPPPRIVTRFPVKFIPRKSAFHTVATTRSHP